MRQHRSRIGALVAAAWLLGVALACSDDPNCDDDCGPLEDALEDSLNGGDLPCDSLGEEACERSGRCVMGSVCAAPACTGPGCSRTCELVRACVPY